MLIIDYSKFLTRVFQIAPNFSLMAEANVNVINNKKCYSCGKDFRTPSDLLKHKNRKTPCLIREVQPEQIQNPNRCIYCNKVFSTRSNLTKHHQTCKIKNGGMEILVDKVKMEQEIRIIKEREQQKDEQIKILLETQQHMRDHIQEQHKQFQERMNQLETLISKPDNKQVINVNNININNGVQNIVINNYLKPSLNHLVDKKNIENSPFLKIFKEQCINTPIALIPYIWFNPDVPENFGIYLQNKNGKVITHDGNNWVYGSFREGVDKTIRDRVYEITEKIANAELFRDKVDSYVACRIDRNKNDEETIKIEYDEIFQILLQNSDLVKPYVKLASA